MPKEIRTNVEPGEFPFPIIDGPEESRYLTWIRNHSNYMAVRGLPDYARIVGVLLRGMFINSLVILPYLIILSIGVAAANLFLPPFRYSVISLFIGVVIVLSFPLLTPLFKIVRHRAQLRTGSDSSVKARDRYERVFGGILILILAAVGFESLSFFLDNFHQLVANREFGGKQFASIVAVAAVILTNADKVLSVLAGVAQKIAIIVIGVIGLLVPLLVVLFISDFLVFSPPSLEWSIWVFWALSVLSWLISIGLALGVFFGFTAMDTLKAFMLLGLVSAVAGGIFLTLDEASKKNEVYDKQLHLALDELDEIFILSTDKERLEPRRYYDKNRLGDGVRLQQIEEDANKLVKDVAIQLSDTAKPVTPLSKLMASLEYNRSFEAEYSNTQQFPPWPRPNPDTYQDLIALADVAFLFDLRSLDVELRKLLEEEKKPPNVSGLYEEIDRLQRRVNAIPLEIFQKQTPAEFVKMLLNLTLDDINTLIDREITKGEYGWVDLEPPPEYSKLSTLVDISVTKNALDTLGEQLLDARVDLAIMANYSRTRFPEIYKTTAAKTAHRTGFVIKFFILIMLAIVLWLIARLTVDINLTSIHGLYRDRLASAFLVGQDTKGDVDIEKDLDLAEICRHEAGSTAPYHLINVALNLQSSKDISIRDRQSDFFVFSKKFTGGRHTGYCRSDNMELVFPQMSLASAMAISAAAASPNMGRSTSPALLVIMTLLNIRLGYWIPNPGRLEHWLWKRKGEEGKQNGYTFEEIFQEELVEITRRWEQLSNGSERHLSTTNLREPTSMHGLVGIAYSGGGIRSATINLGITQELHKHGVFDHVDFMSTVSGGGYLGSSISALMRRKTKTVSEIKGQVGLKETDTGEKVVTVSQKPHLVSRISHAKVESRDYKYAAYAKIAVKEGDKVGKGHRLLSTNVSPSKRLKSFSAVYGWRVRPGALLREAAGLMNDTHRWVNVSDGGHIENLASIELLRRRCKYIVIGDGEADPEHHFGGLATLVRTARIDLGVHIEIDLTALRLGEDRLSRSHSAIGRIHYPAPDDKEPGYLLYLKSSITGDEDEVIQQYRHANPSFPHESTADQFFGEGQFEAYRSLGQHMAKQVLKDSIVSSGKLSYSELEDWFRKLYELEAGSARKEHS